MAGRRNKKLNPSLRMMAIRNSMHTAMFHKLPKQRPYVKDHPLIIIHESLAREKLFIKEAKISQTLKSFPRFKELPPEIRFRVFYYNLPEGRMLRVEPSGHPYRGLRCREPAPANLHICRESREQALQYYELAFNYTNINDNFLRPMPERLYFDFSRDSLHFDFGHGKRWGEGRRGFPDFPDMERVRFLSVNSGPDAKYAEKIIEEYEKHALLPIRQFHALELLTLISDGNWNHAGRITKTGPLDGSYSLSLKATATLEQGKIDAQIEP